MAGRRSRKRGTLLLLRGGPFFLRLFPLFFARRFRRWSFRRRLSLREEPADPSCALVTEI